MSAKKPAAKPKVLNADKAAELLGITADELNRSWARGLEPGALAKRVGGVLVWSETELKAYRSAQDARSGEFSPAVAPDTP